MTKLKKYSTLSDWEAAKEDNLEYPSVGLINVSGNIVYMPLPPIHKRPIKAVFYDSSTGSFVKLYPSQITEANPNYTPIGVEVIPAEHDVYGTGQSGIMSLVYMNYTTPDTGSTSLQGMYFGGGSTNTSLPNLDKVNVINHTIADKGYLPSDQFTGATSLDSVSKYCITSNNIPSPYNADGSRNEAYYTTDYSTANALSDFDGVGNTAILTELATGDLGWKTASTIINNPSTTLYPAACCCWRFHTTGTNQGQWYLPAMGELGYVINRISAINKTINKVLNVYSSVVAVEMETNRNFWASSEYSAKYVRSLATGNGGVEYNGKSYSNNVRAFLRL